MLLPPTDWLFIYLQVFFQSVDWWNDKLFFRYSVSKATSFNYLYDSFLISNIIYIIYDYLGLPLCGFPSDFPSIIVVIHVLFLILRCSIHFSLLSTIVSHIDLLSFILWYTSSFIIHSIQEIFKILSQYHVSKASIFLLSVFIIVHDSFYILLHKLYCYTSVSINVFLVFIFITFVVRSFLFLKNTCFSLFYT